MDGQGNTWSCTALHIQHVTPGSTVNGFKISEVKATVNTACLGSDGVYKEDLESATSAKANNMWPNWALPDAERARMSRETQTWLDATRIKKPQGPGGLLAPGTKDKIMAIYAVQHATLPHVLVYIPEHIHHMYSFLRR